MPLRYIAFSFRCCMGLRRQLHASLLALFIGICALFSFAAHADQDFLEPEDAFALRAAMATPTALLIQFKIAPNYYMYREQFDFALSPAQPWSVQPVLPKGKIKYDPTFDKEMEIYTTAVQIVLPLQAGATEAFTLEVTSQGCAEAGLCYAPMHTFLQLAPTMGGYDVSGVGAGSLAYIGAVNTGGSDPSSRLTALSAGGDVEIAEFLTHASLWHIALAGLLLGLLLSFTPCVLPMVPILLTLIAGSAAQPQARSAKSRSLTLAFLYVLGMSIVYTGLGVAAGLLGVSLAAWLQTPWVLALFASLLALLALAMFDVFHFQAPLAMQTALQIRLARIPGGQYSGAFFMGMLSALIVGPCVAAPLAGVLLFISSTGDVVLGGFALFALAWGQGVLLLVLGASSGALLPRAGAWMEQIKHVFGVLLLATAWWMLIPVLPSLVLTLGWVLLAFWAALILGALRPLPTEAGPARMFVSALGYALFAWAVLMLIGLASGSGDPLRPLAGSLTTSAPPAKGAQMANASDPHFANIRSPEDLRRALSETRQPVMLDFYADWCISCKEMERFTFSDPKVAQQMAQFTLLQADVTADTVEDRALLKQFRLFGPPGMIFFDAQGQVLPKTRIIGFQNAQRFSVVLDRVLSGAAQ